MKLNNKTAIVTGSRRGIGRAIALALAKDGANVTVSDINQEDCQKVVAEIEKMGRKGLAVKCDVSSAPEVEELVKKTVAEFGRLDILVNNAGIISYKPFLELTEEDWDKLLGVNLKGQFLCAQAAAREMIKNNWGRIINIASISSGGCGIAFPLIAHYTASKGGVMALTEALALELTARGINVNAICPGAIDTDMTKGAKESGQLEPVLLRIPKGRLGKPEEIANLAVFLASEEASYIAGAAIVIDGGWLTS
ncbi:MAG TPA: SDR family NAD(P)-dependent oxidoreductase [Dehalococcoidales bacterium]|nr:SDR family NAD(P)-dependent oxidoreductase [Dehalococcoidales bacterium]